VGGKYGSYQRGEFCKEAGNPRYGEVLKRCQGEEKKEKKRGPHKRSQERRDLLNKEGVKGTGIAKRKDERR